MPPAFPVVTEPLPNPLRSGAGASDGYPSSGNAEGPPSAPATVIQSCDSSSDLPSDSGPCQRVAVHVLQFQRSSRWTAVDSHTVEHAADLVEIVEDEEFLF